MMGYSTIIHNKFAVTAKLEVNFLIQVSYLMNLDLAWVKKIDGKKFILSH